MRSVVRVAVFEAVLLLLVQLVVVVLLLQQQLLLLEGRLHSRHSTKGMERGGGWRERGGMQRELGAERAGCRGSWVQRKLEEERAGGGARKENATLVVSLFVRRRKSTANKPNQTKKERNRKQSVCVCVCAVIAKDQ